MICVTHNWGPLYSHKYPEQSIFNSISKHLFRFLHVNMFVFVPANSIQLYTTTVEVCSADHMSVFFRVLPTQQLLTPS